MGITTDHGDLIVRIRKILSKTEENGCSEAEAERAFAVASRLMAEHNLAMDEVERHEGDGEPSWLDDDAYETGRWTLEDQLTCGIVREYFFVKAYFSGRFVGNKWKKVLRFFGRADNVATAKWAFTALMDAFDRLFAEHRKATGCAASERRIFVSGMADGFKAKMEDERRAMEAERDIVRGQTGGSTALAIRGIEEQTLAAYREHVPGVFKKNGAPRYACSYFAPVTGSSSAFEAGHKAGRSLNLNRAVSGGNAVIKGLPGS